MADLPCPTCGSALTFLEQYQRYYCHRCLQYAPEGYGDRGAQTCPTCGGILSYVRQYGKMYCYHCNTYPPEAPAKPATEAAPATAPEPAAVGAPAPSPTGTPVVQTAPSPLQASPVTVDATPPTPAPPTPPSEPAPEEIRPDEPKPEEPAPTAEEAKEPEVAPVAIPESPPAEKPAEPAPIVPSREMRALAAQRPAAVRVKLFALKKPELVDLATVYHLDASGSKEDLQDRLLSHLHDLETEGPAQGAVAPEEMPTQAPAIVATPTNAPTGTPPPTVATQAAAPLVVEKPEPAPAAVPAVPAIVTPTPVVPETPRVVPRAEHPCPTCGRELTYISQYNRYYCYSCQRYAPAGARAKNACPTCGSTMRWIDQHRRWWCDSCQKYASADLPPPGGAAREAAPSAEAAPAVREVVVHRHGSPAGGAGLVGFGLALYIVYAFFGFLGGMLGFVRPAGITTQALDALQFFAFLLVALGAIVGLYGLRDRR